MKKLISLMLLVCFAMTAISCGKGDKTVRQLKEKSAELTIYARQLSKAFNDGYEAGEITKENLATFGKLDDGFNAGLTVYREAIVAAEQVYKETKTMPTGTLNRIDRILSAEVMSPFFNLVVNLGVMPFAQSEKIQAIIAGIRLTLLTLQNLFSDARDQLVRLEENYA